MPKELYKTFVETIKRIEQQPGSRSELGIRTMMWISHALRPIFIDELQHALAVNPEDTSLDQDNCPSPKLMVDCSLGLVTIDEESSTIRLVHLSLYEFFKSQRQSIFPRADGIVQ